MMDQFVLQETIGFAKKLLIPFTILNHNLLILLNYTSLTKSLISHPASRFITISLLYCLIFILVHALLIKLGVLYEIGHGIFIDTPVHCAHLYVSLNIFQNGKNSKKDDPIKFYDKKTENGKLLLKKTLNYHIEFGPTDYDPRNPEYGTTLKFLRNKVLELFINSNFLKQNLNDNPEFGKIDVNNIRLFHKKKELLNDDEFLCLLGVETGHGIDCFIDI
ncbi:hypothetical protein PACTADRAFT_1200 [Pachysolen tannophilus NRRL Y-2460]|uniref:Uncharacterized protein n=1 Tax=Pachysolen tannophilus NRRL Y-2460 TaxID=669874 RepID=A0A1E4TXX3_PACTA|nr:hypothetical protein PACTADRAFT_1200 [Pachysolen tannophilus NRRL Y-2460]